MNAMSCIQANHTETTETKSIVVDRLDKQRMVVDEIDANGDETMCICPVCGFSAPTPCKLDGHMETAHGDAADDTERCCLVSYSTPKHSIHRRHTSMDLGEAVDRSQYSTDFNYSSQNSPPLVDGSRSGDSLQIPTSMFTQIDDTDRLALKQNILQTDSRRRYRCSMCASNFPWHGDLTDHLREVHGVRKTSREASRRVFSVVGTAGRSAGTFLCPHCKYVAKYQSELRRHLRLHWGVKPFTCVFCAYRSAWKGDLKRHMESHHKACFNSEAELVQIMAQFKNNAGTAALLCAASESPNSTNESSPSVTPQQSSLSINMVEKPSNHHCLVLDKDCNSLQLPCQRPSTHLDAAPNLQSSVTFENSSVAHELEAAQNQEPGLVSTGTPLPPLGLFPSADQYAGLIGAPVLNTNQILCSSEVIKALLSQSVPDQLSSLLFPQRLHNAVITDEPLNLVYKPEMGVVLDPPPPTRMTPHHLKPPQGKRRTIAKSSAFSSVTTTPRIGSEGGGAIGGGGIREEQWKRYQCSGCGHRSNWKWDINKHIKVAHPERTEITTITMSLEEARLTLPKYLEKVQTAGRGRRPSTYGASGSDELGSPASSVVSGQLPIEGYYRPFKCTVCGHRSNWKWDVKKHIKQMHSGSADVITLSNDEARRTIDQYKSCRRQAHGGGAARGHHWSLNHPSKNDPKHPRVEPVRKQHSSPCGEGDGQPVRDNNQAVAGETPPEGKNLPAVLMSAFRCNICKRRFHTWTSLQQHALFGHSSGMVTPIISINATSNGVSKRSYKKSLLQKALASASSSSPRRRRRRRRSQPTMASKSSSSSSTLVVEDRLSFAETILTTNMFLQPPTDRNLFPPSPSAPLPTQSPLRSSTNANLLPHNNNNNNNNNQESKLIQQQSNKVFQLTELLQQVLQFLVSSADEEENLKAVPGVDLSLENSEKMASLMSSDENENDPSTAGDESDRLARLLLQPQVQPLVSQLSALFHMATQNNSTATLTDSGTSRPTQQ